jgi:hypothetical protein
LIEKELAHRIGKPVAAAPIEPVAALPPIEPAAPAVTAAGSCACGTVNDPDARFCKSCGAKLRAA